MGSCLLSVLACPILQAQTASNTSLTPLTAEQKATLDEAERLTRMALELHEAKKLDEAIRYGNESPELFDSIDYLVKIYDSAGKISDRNALYLRVVSILEKRRVRPIDRPLLFRYHCSVRSGKQSADTAATLRRIEALLSWDPANAKAPADGGILNGRALLLATPEYPAEARAVGASGTVSVEVEIDECGNVLSTKVLSGSSFLRRVSEAAARQSRFSPTMVDGTPVKVKGVIQYNFSRRKP